MTDPSTDINVREQALPGVGQRFEIELSPERQFVVIAHHGGQRSIGISEPGHDPDEVDTTKLSVEQSVMVGALLLGARFAIDVAEDPKVAGDTVIVDTVRVPEDAASIGRRPSELLAPWHPDAAMLGVIRDRTPEIVEHDGDLPLAAGDRVAIAARRDLLDEVARLFTG